MLRAVGHTPCRVGLAASLGTNDLPAIVAVTQVLLLVRSLHLVASSAHGALSLSWTFLLESIIKQLILVQVIGQRQVQLNLLMLRRCLAREVAILNLLSSSDVFGGLVTTLAGISRGQTLLVYLLVILARLKISKILENS